MSEREAITDPRLLLRCLLILAAVVLGFVLHSALHLEPSLVALLGAGAMVFVSRVSPPSSWKKWNGRH